ncbi:MAG: hypothetical protein ACM3KM_03000 [Acidobacteriaceae bacterium]
MLTDERRGQIALASLHYKLLKEGMNLHPQNLRSQMGNLVNELNKQNPTLNLTQDEANEFLFDLAMFLTNEAFRPNRKSEKQGHLSGKAK